MLEERTDSNIDYVDNFDIISFRDSYDHTLLEITQKKDKKAVEEMEKYKKRNVYFPWWMSHFPWRMVDCFCFFGEHVCSKAATRISKQRRL